jgi:serpin B
MKTRLTSILCILVSLAMAQRDDKQAEIHNNFSLKVYKATATGAENLFISPYSLRIAMLAASAGANGETRIQFENLVGNFAQANGFLREISGNEELDFFYKRNPLEVANSVWTNNSFSVKDSFVKTLKNDLHSDHFSFNPTEIHEVATRIDSWVDEKTHGKITNMPPPGPGSACIIINAIYFQDKWRISFKNRKTKLRTFRAIDGTKQELPTMFSDEMYNYYETPDMQALRLGYESQFEMIILLPRKDSGLKDLESTIDHQLIRDIQIRSTGHPVSVFLPKFKLKNEIEMTSILADNGFADLFAENADYTGISEAPGVSPGSLIHKTFIEIDEKQTEAAAVSEFVVVGAGRNAEPPPPPEPKVFRADHPFMFLIVDSYTKGIVFAGRFVRGE